MVSPTPTVAATLAAGAWDVNPAVGLLVLAFAVGGLLAIGWLWRSTAPTRISPGPATMELRDEHPALVDLLTGGFQVEDDAVPATLVDLAARRHVEIDELGGKVTIRSRRHGSHTDDELTAYEQRVLTHLEQHAVGGVVPAEVITLGPEGVSERWFKSFVREVNRHGQSLGLCRRRFDAKHLAFAWGIVIVAFAPAWIVANVTPRTPDPRGWGSIGNLFVGLAFLVGFGLVWVAQRISRSNAQHDTADGRTAAAHWLGVRDHYRSVGDFEDKPAASVAIWERHLAYATAMGLAPVVQRQLPFETEHDRHAWSRATGQWRRIKIRYLSFVPSWGQHPGRVAFEGLLQAAFAGAIAYGGYYVASAELEIDALSDDQRRWIGLGGLVVAAIASAACLFALVKLVLGASDLFVRRTIEGEVVRTRVFLTGHRLPKVVRWMAWSGRDEYGMSRQQQRRTRHHVAIDQGDDDSIVAHVVRPTLYGSVRQGARVRAVLTPRLGYVKSIEMLEPPRPSAAGAPTVHHELVEQAVTTAGSKLAGSMQTALSNLEGATDDNGRPILDQTDDDGVTVRERLAESTDQLDRLRNDPRLKNSPIGGLLDAFLSPSKTDPEVADANEHPESPDTDRLRP